MTGKPLFANAETAEEWKALLAGDESGVVRSRADWERVLEDHELRSAMFGDCPPQAVAAFTDKLEFRNGGLAHAEYGMLAEYVTLRQFDTVLNSFGIGSRLATDYRDMECESPGTCSYAQGKICTGNC